MDYEKAYKEALERARKLKENPKAIFFEEKNIHISDYIFPELKEYKEDERIRKDIIWCLKHSGIKLDKPINPHVSTIMKDALTWLERQVEKPQGKTALEAIKEEIVNNANKADSIKLAESEDERIRKRLIEFFKDWGKTRSHCWSISILDILAWLEKQANTDGGELTIKK